MGVNDKGSRRPMERQQMQRGILLSELVTWVDCSLGWKRGKDSIAAVRGSLKLIIGLSTKEREFTCYTAS